MKSVLALLAAFALTVPAHSAGSFDGDVFGSYVGFTNGSAFRLRFSPGLAVSASYRFRGVPLRESYRLSGTGHFTGIWKARGRLIATVAGTWTNSPRSLKASGKARLSSGGQRHFSVRLQFGQGTVSVVTRASGGVVRSTGVKS
jgi:hypothetical protein